MGIRNGMFDENYSDHKSLADLHYKRAIGEVSEMESSKAMARMVQENFSDCETVAEIGCSSGHYLYSLLKLIPEDSFMYTGVELHDLFFEKAKTAWAEQENASFRQGSIFDIPAKDKEFDLVYCSNLLMHLPTIVDPIRELLRIAKRRVIIRTYIGRKSFKIQEVKNNSFWPGSSISPEEEFDDNGNPRFFEYENIWGQEYFSSVVKRFAPDAQLRFIEDTFFSAEAIEETAKNGNLPNPTRTLGGMQIFDYILLPYHFVIIDL